MQLGTPQFRIRCERLEETPIGHIAFEIEGEVFGDFDQPCVLSGVAMSIADTLGEIESESRKDSLLSRLDPATALDRVYSVFSGEGESEDDFWFRRFIWLDSAEPFDGFRSMLLAKPEGLWIAWDSQGSQVHQALVPVEVYQTTVYDLLAWLEISGLGSFVRPLCVTTSSGERLHKLPAAYDKALKRATVLHNREKKAAAKERQRSRSLTGSNPPDAP